jgi:PST family polysaccharide transporter
MANYACYWVFLAKGLTTSYLIFSAVTRPFLIASLIAGSFFGAMGVALSYSFASLLLWPATLLWLKRVSDAPVGRMFALGIRTICVYLCAGLSSYGIGLALAGVSTWIALPVSLLGFVAALLVAMVLVPPFKRDVLETVALRRFAGRRS